MAEGVKYIKVAKIDANGVDQTLSLQSLSELTIPYSTGNIRYEILSISEHDNYFLYSVDNPNIEHADRALIEYKFTGSANTIETPVSGAKIIDEISITSVSDPLLFSATSSINSSINIVKLNTYPQKDLLLSITGSLVIDNAGGGGSYNGAYDPVISITEHQSNGTINELIDLSNTGPGANTTHNFLITHSIANGSSPGTEFGFRLTSQKASTPLISGSYEFSNTQVFITSSVASGPTMETIPEPYFSQNFNRSLDCQPTLNNATTNRLSSKYQDVDYSSDLMVPVNFDLLISGSALKAEVQDSNYSSKRHTLPRYEGSKSTSQFLNVFTRGDKGTYGVAPTVEQLDTLVAYSDWAGGYLPEHNNAFGAHLKYLIKSNGDVVIPGSTPNSLEDNKNIFNFGDSIEISSEIQSSNGDPGELRTVIRGGERITPILTNQVGHSPAVFSSSMDMVNADGVEIGTVTNDFNGSFNNDNLITGQVLTRSGSFINFQSTRLQSSGSHCNVNDSKLIISQPMIDQGISLTIEGDIKFKINRNQAGPIKAYAIIKNLTTDTQLAYEAVNGTGEFILSDSIIDINNNGKLNIQHTINNTDMVVGDEYGIQVAGIVPDIENQYTQFDYPFYVSRGSTFKVAQNPIPGTEVPTAGIWKSGSLADCSWPYTLISTDPTIVNFYGNNQAKQKPIGESGFFDFENYWGIEPGDEFRFEAREDRVFTVKDSYVSSSRLFIEVDKNLPFSGSQGVNITNIGDSGSIDYSKFLIRRYVDDPSGLIIEGSKPTGAGPYIIKPQFTNPELNENLSTYIENLKEKGII